MSSDIGKKRILYVEDNPETYEMVAYMLDVAGVDFAVAGTEVEAWKLASKERFDLYLLDGLQPHGAILNLCRRLRQLHPETPVLFYLPAAFESELQIWLDAGANGHLETPVVGNLSNSIVETIQKLRQMLRGSERSS